MEAKVIECYLGDFHAEINRLNRRASKLGLAPIECREIRSEFEERTSTLIDGKYEEYTVHSVKVFYFDVEGSMPVLPGFRLLAKIDPGPVENLIVSPRGVDVALVEPFRKTSMGRCDHCHQNRPRKAAFLVLEEATGKLMQVGSTCMRDFCGYTEVSKLLTWWDQFKLIFVKYADEEEGGGSYRVSSPTYYDIHQVLNLGARIIQKHGWKPSKVTDATCDRVYMALTDRTASACSLREECRAPSKESEAIIMWILVQIDPAGSAYFRNLQAVLANGMVSRNQLGLLVSAIPSYGRWVNHNKPAESKGSHVGIVGEVWEGIVTVERVQPLETNGPYPKYLVKLSTEDGSKLTWFGSSGSLGVQECGEALDKSTSLQVKTRIVRHEEFRGTPQTIITRPTFRPIGE